MAGSSGVQSILDSLQQDVQQVGQGATAALVAKVKDSLNGKAQAASDALNGAPGAAAPSKQAVASTASTVEKFALVAAAVGLLGVVAVKAFRGALRGG